MAIHERGYRPYSGGFKTQPSPFSITDTGVRIILRTWGFRLLALLVIIIFLIVVVGLYTQLQVEHSLRRGAMAFGRANDGQASVTFEQLSVWRLRQAFAVFLTSGAALSAILALLVGSGIVADDIRSRALSLYLVRPIRPMTYALGKALIVPAILTITLLIPALLIVLLVAMWQTEIGFWQFLINHPDLLGIGFRTWLLASLSFSGVMLFFSSRTERRGRVVALSSAVYFGGMMLQGIGAGLRGTNQDVLKHASLISNVMTEALISAAEAESVSEAALMRDALPGSGAIWLIALAVFGTGLHAVWRRACSVEVSA